MHDQGRRSRVSTEQPLISYTNPLIRSHLRAETRKNSSRGASDTGPHQRVCVSDCCSTFSRTTILPRFGRPCLVDRKKPHPPRISPERYRRQPGKAKTIEDRSQKPSRIIGVVVPVGGKRLAIAVRNEI